MSVLDGGERVDDPVAVLGVEVVGDLLTDQFRLVVPVEALDGRTLVQHDPRLVQQRQEIGRVQREPVERGDVLQVRALRARGSSSETMRLRGFDSRCVLRSGHRNPDGRGVTADCTHQ